MRFKHLTQEAFLELAAGRLVDDKLRVVSKHLAECSRCRKEYEEFRLAHALLGRVVEMGYQEALDETARETMAAPGHWRHIPWRPVVAALGCIVVAAAFFYPTTVEAARTSELLAKAVVSEGRHTADRKFLVEVGGQTCVRGQRGVLTISMQRASPCYKALQQIRGTRWDKSDPLSARTFTAWRNSLQHHSDHLRQDKDAWEIETSTTTDAVHRAKLSIDASSFETKDLTLTFSDNQELRFSEDTAKPLPATVADSPVAAAHVVAPSESPAGDPIEVESWELLHQLGADTGWEALVLRNGENIRVTAVVRDEARREDFVRAFSARPEVQLDLRSSTAPGDIRGIFPDRIRSDDSSPALATDWLEHHLPDIDQRAEFSNRLQQLSREVLGRAFLLDKLHDRRPALAHCDCVKTLDALLATEIQAQRASEIELFSALGPMLNTPLPHSEHLLTFEDARDLDSLTHQLFWRSSGACDADFDAAVTQMYQLIVRGRQSKAHALTAANGSSERAARH